MSGWFVPGETYRRELRHPDSGEESYVVLRPLNAGDRAELEDTVQIEAGEQREDGEEAVPRTTVRMGLMKLLTVERAVVEWGLPVSPTRETIRRLDPEVLDAIFALVSFGGIPEEEEADGEESELVPLVPAAAAPS
jgi:hypothetical protein